MQSVRLKRLEVWVEGGQKLVAHGVTSYVFNTIEENWAKSEERNEEKQTDK